MLERSEGQAEIYGIGRTQFPGFIDSTCDTLYTGGVFRTSLESQTVSHAQIAKHSSTAFVSC